jgi:SNF2 family DNA or RNA helicase
MDAQASALRRRLRARATSGEPDLPARLSATLRPYQRQGLAWLQLLRELGTGGVLADDMGLGKTIMTLAFLARWKEDAGGAPSLVVCPTSVVGNWAREAERFTPGLRVLVLHGDGRAEKARTMADFDLVVTTYAVLRRDVEHLAATTFRCAVLDEAQNVKNAAARTTGAARRLRAEMRLALSGTPIENRLAELWSIMAFANPGILGTAEDFDERFERPITTRPDGQVAERLRAIVRPFVLRRTKAEVLAELPPKTEIDRVCVCTMHQKRLYDALAHQLRQSVKKKVEQLGLGRCGMSVLTALLRLRQMACDPRLVDPRLMAETSAKRAAFLELARELAAEGRRALVFSQFVELLSLWRVDLEREGIAYEYLDGSSTDRERIVDRFQNGEAPLFLMSLKAGGAGLNLTAADTVIHCDPWWNPAAEDQATDRAHRMGQRRAVTVVRLVARGTIEDKIALLKRNKRELVASVMGVGDGALRGLSEEDVRALLGDVSGEVDRDADDDGASA